MMEDDYTRELMFRHKPSKMIINENEFISQFINFCYKLDAETLQLTNLGKTYIEFDMIFSNSINRFVHIAKYYDINPIVRFNLLKGSFETTLMDTYELIIDRDGGYSLSIIKQ